MSEINQNSAAHLAGIYRKLGYGIVRLQDGKKVPTHKGWTTFSQEPDHFREGDNIGILLGRLSNNLVCVDIDDADLLPLADDHLPPTGMIEGRAGKQKAHWYYLVTDIPDKFVATCAGGIGGPKTQRYPGLDLQGTGSQVAAPPSIHPSGERREWVSDNGMPGKPATVSYLVLLEAVEALLKAAGKDFKSKLIPEPSKGSTARKKPLKAAKTGEADQTADEVPKANCSPITPLPGPMRFDDKVLERAFFYLTHINSIEGKGGSSALYRACRLMVNDFALPRDESLKILLDWDSKVGRCVPPWDVEAVKRTLLNAIAAGVDDKYPFGCKRIEGGSFVPKAFNDPSRLAGEFIAENGDTLVHWKGSFYRYTGTHYERLTDDSVEDAVRLFCGCAFNREYTRAEKAASDALEDGKPKKPTRKTITTPLVREVVLELRANHSLPDTVTMPSMLDGSVCTIIACRNGLLDLTGEPRLLAHTAQWFASSVLPFDFNADAGDDPTFASALSQWFGGSVERVAIAQEWAGYLLSGSHIAHKYLCLLGSGRNGKSSFSAMLQALVGPDNCSHIGWANLDDRFVMSQAQGKLLNVSDDIDDIERQPEGRIKELLTGQPIFLETKGKDGYFTSPTVRLMVCGNKLPRVRDQSDGLRRRQLLIRFDGQVPTSSVRPGMDRTEWWLENANMAAILNWAVEGLQRLRANNWQFTVSAQDEAILNDHKSASDPLGQWIEERVVIELGANVPTQNAYDDYSQWGARAGYRNLLGRLAFTQSVTERLKEKGVSKAQRKNCATGPNLQTFMGMRIAK